MVEVSGATLQRDQTLKLRLSAAASIPVYRVMNLPDNRLEVHTEPAESSYRIRRVYTLTDQVLLILDGVEIAKPPVKDMFG